MNIIRQFFAKICAFFTKKGAKPAQKEETQSEIIEKVLGKAKYRGNPFTYTKDYIIKYMSKIVTSAYTCQVCEGPLRHNNPRQVIFYCSKICRHRRHNRKAVA